MELEQRIEAIERSIASLHEKVDVTNRALAVIAEMLEEEVDPEADVIKTLEGELGGRSRDVTRSLDEG